VSGEGLNKISKDNYFLTRIKTFKMGAKLHELFEDYKGKLPDQEKCSKIISEIRFDGHSLYMEALKLTHEDLKAKHKYPTRNIFATTFNAYVIGLAEAKHPQWIRISEDRRVNRVYLEPLPGFRIYLKQLYGKSCKPSNVDTDNVDKMNTSQLFDHEDGRISVIYVGALMEKKSKYDIDEVRASYVNLFNREAQWSLNLIDYVQTNTVSISKHHAVEDSLLIEKGATLQRDSTGTTDK
jgi:hypothetical protein